MNVWQWIKSLIKPRKAKASSGQEKSSEELHAKALAKTRGRFLGKIADIFSQSKKEDALRQELEELLYTADLGTEVVEELLQSLENIKKPWTREAVLNTWQKHVRDIFTQAQEDNADAIQNIVQKNGQMSEESNSSLHVLMLVGVNGAGKTTTTAKLAHYLKNKHKLKVMLAAADTFRAAAAEQLGVWAKRLEVDCIAQQHGADPAAVVYNAVEAAKARGIQLLIIDTGGRLHTKDNLMGMLRKMRASVEKAHGKSVDHTYLVIDGNVGQNGLVQAKEFHKQTPLSGVIVTKLDGTAKGGVTVSISKNLKLPIAFIGTGEQLDDFTPFLADAYSKALLESPGAD